MDFTKFGKKMTCKAGILSLMDDLGQARLANENMIMMGGGNPGVVPEFQEIIRQQLLEICSDRKSFQQLVGSYAPPQGEKNFCDGLAALLKKELGWAVGPENICLTNGSQTAFFMLFNLFAGVMPEEYAGVKQKKICLPLAPEYIGYADLGLTDDLFIATKPKIELLGDDFFKYHIDFANLQIDESIGAICISRPTNPTGNVVTDQELTRLADLAARHDIPLIIDSAYGLPFPRMIFTEAAPLWNENIIVCLSLSKLGLPAVRTGIVIARREIIRTLTGMNAIMSLTPTNFGAVLTERLVMSGAMTTISKQLMQPFYRLKKDKTVAVVKEKFAGIPCRMHIPEGAMFLWLWFRDLPITSLQLYERLKENGVLVVSGHYFFPGLRECWQHKNECLRVTYSQDDDDVRQGLAIIAEVVRKAYKTGC